MIQDVLYSPSRAEIGESGFSRYDVPVRAVQAVVVEGKQVDRRFNKEVAV